MAGNGDGDLYSRVAQVAKRISTDKSRFTDEIAKLQDLVEEAQRRETEATEEVEKLRQALAAQSTEVDAMKKKSNRDMALNNGIQSPHSPSVSKHDLSAAKEEITGLKWVVLHEPEIVCSYAAQTYRSRAPEGESCGHPTNETFGVGESASAFRGRATASGNNPSCSIVQYFTCPDRRFKFSKRILITV